MKITETHKDFGGGMKGRLTVRDGMDQLVAVILTPVQKARKYCEDHPESPEGLKFAEALHDLEVVRVDATEVTVPSPPVLAGANPSNTALVSAQRKLVKLHEAAQGAEPVQALLAIHTSRGNKYLNTCDDYRKALLRHFGHEVLS
jgi:hypothetical protein